MIRLIRRQMDNKFNINGTMSGHHSTQPSHDDESVVFFSYFFTLLKDFFTTRLHIWNGNHDDDEQMGQEWMDAAPLLITLYISPCHYIGIDMLLLPTVPNTAYES